MNYAFDYKYSLPEPLSSYVDAKVAAWRSWHSEPIHHELIQEDHDRRGRNLEEHLLSALSEDSKAFEVSDEDWQHDDDDALMESHAA